MARAANLRIGCYTELEPEKNKLLSIPPETTTMVHFFHSGSCTPIPPFYESTGLCVEICPANEFGNHTRLDSVKSVTINSLKSLALYYSSSCYGSLPVSPSVNQRHLS